MVVEKRVRVVAQVAAVVLAAVLAVGVTGTSTAEPANRAAVKTRIGPASPFDAPIGKKGGVENPVAWCSDYSSPRTRWTVTNTTTGWTKTYRWTGSLPGMYFPRVPVGQYKSRTVAKCHGVAKTRIQFVTVKEKTLRGTVSKAEWRRIHRGMTRARVSRIVGSSGRDPFRWDGKLTVTYDMMPFWRWSIISYRNGRVVDKHWNVGHD